MTPLTERGKAVRRHALRLAYEAHSGHIGGSLSCVEILLALYDRLMNPDSQFILSKGHACWSLYAILRDRGHTPKLLAHPERDPWNGIEATTGSLGHGLPMALGMAWAKTLEQKPGRVYVLMGDGEFQEGTTWEALQLAAKLQLPNLRIIVDANGIQGSGPLALPLRASRIGVAIGLKPVIVDGHDIEAATAVVERYPMVIARTVKGRGVSFMEGVPAWHSWKMSEEQYNRAIEENR